MPDLGDLALLIKDEGYRGEFFNPESAASLAVAIDKILSNDTYRKELAMSNFEAASALSMDKIINKYIECFKSVQ
jgi:glycosyltransferase involved in cell wall biosynthesis